MRSHAELDALGRWRLSLSCSENGGLENRYRVLITVLEIDREHVPASLMLHSALRSRKVICPTAINILIIVTRVSLGRLATVRSREGVESGADRLRRFEFAFLFEPFHHTFTDRICVFFQVPYDRVYSL